MRAVINLNLLELMKRIIDWLSKRTIDWLFIIGVGAIVIAGIGTIFFGGFHKKQQPMPARKQPPPVVRKIAPSKLQPAKPSKEILPGTIEYLDMKNGFRDAIFGRWDTNFSNLVLKGQDPERQLKTYTRAGDDLSLEGVPLNSIEYTFFKGQLCKVSLTWKREYPDNAINIPPTTDISVSIAHLYGPPTRHQSKREFVDNTWRGRKAEILLTEFLSSGVADLVNGGWSSPPTTTGQMVFQSIPLLHAEEAYVASQSFRSQGKF